MNRQVILCIVANPRSGEELLGELKTVLENTYTAVLLEYGDETLNKCKALAEDATEIPLVIVDYRSLPAQAENFLRKLRTVLPYAVILLIFDRENIDQVRNLSSCFDLCRIIRRPWLGEDLWFSLQESLYNYRREQKIRSQARETRILSEKTKQERQIVDKLGKILNEKITELIDQQQDMEEISKELNVTTIEKILFEQEALKLSKTLSTLKNSLKNNLFLRSVLHSIVNMLQIQFSIDRRENRVIEELGKQLAATLDYINSDYNKLLLKKEMYDLNQLVAGKLTQQRRKTELNLHKTLFNYVKAVQCTLIGETVHFNAKPSYLLGLLKKVKEKYKEIMESDAKGKKIDFIIELQDAYTCLNILDFSLINIIENLLTNSIRKVMEDTSKKEKWIKVTSYEEVMNNKEYTIIKWMDNGPGIEEGRKKTVFMGDSDKNEEGDHGIGLPDIKASIEAAGGFIIEVGEYGQGATFLIGFPKVYQYEEINFDEDLADEERLIFPPTLAAKKILLVATDKEVLKNYADFFNRSGLKNVTGVPGEMEALALVLSGRFVPDLLVADLPAENELPFTMLEQLKNKGLGIPVILISPAFGGNGKYQAGDLQRLEKYGVKDIMGGPANAKLLFEPARRILMQDTGKIRSKQKKSDNS